MKAKRFAEMGKIKELLKEIGMYDEADKLAWLVILKPERKEDGSSG